MNILSYSGGKDSTALLVLYKKGIIDVDRIINVEIKGWDWPELDTHIKKMEKYCGMEIEKIDISDKIWEGFKKYGFAHGNFRWCTGIKKDEFAKHINKDDTILIGYNYSELKRSQKKNPPRHNQEYPLITHKITKEKCFELCYNEGITFEGIYEHHSRVSCWNCPLQRIGEIEYLYRQRPELWEQLVKMHHINPKVFYTNHTVLNCEYRFKNNKNNWKRPGRKRKKSW